VKIMTMNRFVWVLGLAAASAALGAAAEDAQKLAERCAACHGPGLTKPIAPDYPVLAGQYASYIAHALHEYKAGLRKNAVMSAQAAQLSDAEIAALAEYIDQLPGPLYTPTEVGPTTK
jgi:cytochrome c553